MAGFRDLQIYQLAYELAIRVHKLSLELPKHELYEQGSQVRRSSKSIKDTISEGYGRRKYKADFEKFLIYAIASCDECQGQIDMIHELYPEKEGWNDLIPEYEKLGKMINNYIKYVHNNWNKF